MPSLIPISQPKTPAIDLRRVFGSPITTATIGRVVKFLSAVYFAHSNKSYEEIFRENFITEEFCLCMPTVAAWDAELKLCTAIERHAAGVISDGDIKTVLSEFVAAHTFVYTDSGRTTKNGDCSVWLKDVDLYLLESGDQSFVCNPVQAWLVSLIENKKFKAVRL